MAQDWGKYRLKLPDAAHRSQLGPGAGETSIERKPQGIEELRQKYTPQAKSSGRSLLLFDATGSMALYWNVTMQSIDTIIRRILEVGGQNSVAMKIVAYRDDCDGEKVIEQSLWSQSATELRAFIAGIQATGGGDVPEAVDRALQIAIQEPEVSRIMLVGDAPPHRERDCQREAAELGHMARPVFPIAIGKNPCAHKAFHMIAELSGGKLIELTNQEELFELVTLLIVHDVGGEEKVQEYAQRYQLTSGGARLVKMLTGGAPAQRSTT
jgi:Mg-chelatase subunit ChlD